MALPFSLPTCLNARMKDNVFLKPIIPLATGFNFKMTIGFYAIVGISLNTTVIILPCGLWFLFTVKRNNVIFLFLYCFLVLSLLQCSNVHSNLLRSQSVFGSHTTFHRQASRCVWVHIYHFSASDLLVLSHK